MNDKMPAFIWPLECFNQWSLYENKLKNCVKTKYYLSELLKKWITEITNPLEIPIILNLISDKPEELENKLINIEQYLGKKNLKGYLRELDTQKIPPADQIYQKIKSLDNEIHVYDELKKNSSSICKINFIGDWETKDKIISVKSILDLDLNFQMIENLLRSFFYIKEYGIVRRYNSIWLKNARNCTYNFRNTVLKYLRGNLVDVLQIHDTMYLKYPEIGEPKNYDYLDSKISIDTFVDNNKQKTIAFHFTTNNEIISQITIEFKESPAFNHFYGIQYDTNTYFIDASNFDYNIIIKRIKKYINEFNEKLQKYNIAKSFEGWITLPIHAMYEKYFINNNKSFQDRLIKIRTNKAYKIYLLVIPQHGFDLKNKLRFEI